MSSECFSTTIMHTHFIVIGFNFFYYMIFKTNREIKKNKTFAFRISNLSLRHQNYLLY